MNNAWRYITFRLLFKDKFDARFIFYWVTGFILMFVAKGFSSHLWVLLFFTVFEVYRMRNNLYSLTDAFKHVTQRFLGRVKHGHRRSIYHRNVLGVALVALMMPYDAQAGFKIIMPENYKKPPQSYTTGPKEMEVMNQYWPQSDEFVDNRNIKKGGARDVTLGKLLNFLLPGHFKTTFIAVEIEDMKVQWFSENWTLDQIMGNLAIRYGIMFERVRGTADIRVDWYDEKRCKGADERNKVIRTLCGTVDSYM